jgi:hypothetical protein
MGPPNGPPELAGQVKWAYWSDFWAQTDLPGEPGELAGEQDFAPATRPTPPLNQTSRFDRKLKPLAARSEESLNAIGLGRAQSPHLHGLLVTTLVTNGA